MYLLERLAKGFWATHFFAHKTGLATFNGILIMAGEKLLEPRVRIDSIVKDLVDLF